MTNIQLFLSIGIPTMAVLIGFLLNNARLSSIETSLGSRIGSVESNIGARITGVEANHAATIASLESNLGARIGSLESNLISRITGVESRLTAIEGDLRQFYRDLGAHEAEINNLKSQRRA
jgi:hypothetical protein